MEDISYLFLLLLIVSLLMNLHQYYTSNPPELKEFPEETPVGVSVTVNGPSLTHPSCSVPTELMAVLGASYGEVLDSILAATTKLKKPTSVYLPDIIVERLLIWNPSVNRLLGLDMKPLSLFTFGSVTDGLIIVAGDIQNEPDVPFIKIPYIYPGEVL